MTLATTIGVIGTIVFNFFQVANSFWNHRAQEAIEEGNEKAFHFNSIIGPQLLSFALRFIPSFLVIYFGSSFAKELLASMPQYLIDVMGILGGALPAIGDRHAYSRRLSKKTLCYYSSCLVLSA